MRPRHLDFESPRKRKFLNAAAKNPSASSVSVSAPANPSASTVSVSANPSDSASSSIVKMCLESPKSEKPGAEDKSVESGNGSAAEEVEDVGAVGSGSVAEGSGSVAEGSADEAAPSQGGESRSASRGSSVGEGEWDWMFWCPPDCKEPGIHALAWGKWGWMFWCPPDCKEPGIHALAKG